MKPLIEIGKPEVISFGIDSFDEITGIGGVPIGMVTEIFGPESVGKSSLCLSLVKSAQDKGIKCCYIDAEMAMTYDGAKRFGVNAEELVLARPSNGEESLELIRKMSESGYGLIVVDSVSSLVPEPEYESDFTQQTIGLQARLMSKGMRMIIGRIMNDNTAVVFINQIRDNINKMGFGDKTSTSGGRALKFYSALRIHLARKAWIAKGEEKTGMLVIATIKKNKLSAPMRKAEVEFMFETGWNVLGDRVNRMLESGRLELVGRTYYHNKEKIGNREDAKKWVSDNTK